MTPAPPAWLGPAPGVIAHAPTSEDVLRALDHDDPGPREFAALVSSAAGPFLEPMARRAAALTRRHFGRTISLYAPLYLANLCTSGCAYCGFASDRAVARRRLEPAEVHDELLALKAMGFEEVLLLTGERGPGAGFDYLLECVALAARLFHCVGIEAFPMSTEEYARLARAGCTSVTLYQETYNVRCYRTFHRWGPKADYGERLAAPARALQAGMRSVGLGILLGLTDPAADAIALLCHGTHLRRTFWRSGVTISLPRLRPEPGGFEAPFPVSEALLARIVLAFRIVWPDVPLLLSTRERPKFRDGMAGLGVTKMSAASRTTVGGYTAAAPKDEGQFRIGDERGVAEVAAMLRGKRLEPVFKNWDRVFRDAGGDGDG
ncbi:MAG: 2-iminoacetate synthase ThiH [Deltaproteobacteria bacterium]|nr:2-iminoacetate synthase ThiH [Deltaproteobacteria bacterium]